MRDPAGDPQKNYSKKLQKRPDLRNRKLQCLILELKDPKAQQMLGHPLQRHEPLQVFAGNVLLDGCKLTKIQNQLLQVLLTTSKV